MISKWTFYIIDIAQEIQAISCYMLMMCIVFAILLCVGLFILINDDDEENSKILYRIEKKVLLIVGILLLVITVIPSRETMYEMLIVENAKTENINTITEAIKDSTDYVIEKINEVK